MGETGLRSMSEMEMRRWRNQKSQIGVWNYQFRHRVLDQLSQSKIRIKQKSEWRVLQRKERRRRRNRRNCDIGCLLKECIVEYLCIAVIIIDAKMISLNRKSK